LPFSVEDQYQFPDVLKLPIELLLLYITASSLDAGRYQAEEYPLEGSVNV
jgi:hypothetical protein